MPTEIELGVSAAECSNEKIRADPSGICNAYEPDQPVWGMRGGSNGLSLLVEAGSAKTLGAA